MSDYKLFKKIKKNKKARFYLNSWCICIYMQTQRCGTRKNGHTSYIIHLDFGHPEIEL